LNARQDVGFLSVRQINPGEKTMPRILIAIFSLAALFVSGGCNKTSEPTKTTESMKVRIGYIGLTCEASIFAAYEKGFFKDEGLEPELIKCSWQNYKDTLALGGYDVTQHLVMYFLKPIEQGLDVKFTGGIHRGCLRVQAANNSNINSIAELKGKRIGVPGMGTPPFIFANRVLRDNGIDAGKDITWKVFPAGELGLAIEKGEIDAVANAEPIGSLLLAKGTVHNIADQAVDPAYADEYCCEVVVNGKWMSANPKAAAAATRALLRGAKWVQANPVAAAQLSVEKKYLASDAKLNSVAISHLNYLPSVSKAESSVMNAAKGMQAAGMLVPTTNLDELAKRAFIHLDGVTDEWIEQLQVEKVAGGQVPQNWKITELAKVAVSEKDDCCHLAAVK
jgi:NitT/TauT family transport system substrate-binding protein